MADGSAHGMDDAARLEAALDRIARARPKPARSAETADTAALAQRLDALIAELRGMLKKDFLE
jgi:hypothetical protein